MAVMNIVEIAKKYTANNIFFTLDTHREDYLKTREGKYLPVKHCQMGTTGWMIDERISSLIPHGEMNFVMKESFGAIDLADRFRRKYERKDNKITHIDIVGFATDICVLNNALMLRNEFPDITITVHRDACAGTTEENHLKALDLMRINQIEIV